MCQQSQGEQSSESLLFRCFPIRLSRCLEQANVSRDLADVVFSLLHEKPENTYAALGQSLFLVSMLSQFLFRDPCTSRVICTVFKQVFFFFSLLLLLESVISHSKRWHWSSCSLFQVNELRQKASFAGY